LIKYYFLEIINNKMKISRRSFVRIAGMGEITTLSSHYPDMEKIKTPEIKVLNPYNRVPVSLIIDDSTCLVNMAY